MSKPSRLFTLQDATAKSQGLSCDASGVSLGGAPLLARGFSGFEPRPSHELQLLLTAAYGMQFNTERLVRRLAVAADALNAGDVGRAMIGALHLQLPPLGEDAADRLARVSELIGKYNYNPDEPRDWRGRWTTGDLGESPPAANALLMPVAYNGRYHDQFLQEYAAYLRSKGQHVLTEVRLRMADGGVGARLDILARDSTTGIVYGVEIKTGDDPGFTPGQLTVYAHAMMGESVMATDPRVAAVGLLPNAPLPPIPIYLVWRRNAQSDPVEAKLDPFKMARRYRGEHR